MNHILAIRAFANYGPVLLETYPEGMFPWGARKSAAAVAGRQHSNQNKTPWIPEAVFDPLLAGALFLVEEASSDIIAAALEMRAKPPGRRQAMVDIDRELPAILERYRAQRRPLPAASPCGRANGPASDDTLSGVNLNWLGRQAGIQIVHSKLTGNQRAMIEQALADLGTESGGMDARITEMDYLDGSRGPWRESFTPFSVRAVVGLLITACYIVIAALTGMRDLEVLEIRRGCITPEKDEYDHSRYRLHSTIFKGQGLGGKPEQWLVIKQVVTAIDVLEQLAPEGAGQFLFTEASVTGSQTDVTGRLLFDQRLNTFVRWQNANDRARQLPRIPHVGGQPWHFTTRQFRRTLARELAFRPHGTIASKIHLKHVHAAVSEGYWGPSGEAAQEFLKEVEKQAQEVKQEQILKLFHAFQAGKPMAGGARQELIEDFVAVQQGLEGFKGTVDQRDKRVIELLRKRTNVVHIGYFADCHFTDPRRAVCLQQRGIETADRPIIPACDPMRCKNALIHEEHVPRWNQSIIQLGQLVRDRSIPKNERERLNADKRDREQVIAPFVNRGGAHGDT